jgi:signal transduction histidine kinase/DNA-binding response OmpR family regulator
MAPVDKHADIFIGDGEMARLMRAHDWAATSLGTPDTWPNALKGAVRLLLTSRFDMWMGWGPDIAFLYNDAYRPTLGTKHPHSLAAPTKELWAEIWHDIEPRIRTVYELGEATWDKALLLLLNRHGFPEETYHTFSYSPLVGDTGQVEGVFCAVTEETERVISGRRLDLLRELASAIAAVDSRPRVIAAVEQKLATNRHDLPFSLTYLFDGAGQATLASATGIDRGHRCAPQTLGLDGGGWQLRALWERGINAVQDTTADLQLPHGAWDMPPKQVVLVPLLGQGSDRPLGVMVAGVNPYRPLDEDYLGFVQLLAGQFASGLASADAYEAERQRVAALADAVRLRQQAADALQHANEQLASEVMARTQERDRLRDLFQQAPSFMCLLMGREHHFELVNEAYLQLVGHRDLIGLPVRQALPEIEGQGFFELLDGVFDTGQPFVGHNLAAQLQRTPNGPLQQRFLHLVYQPFLRADGQVAGIFVDGYDVTHQKRAEEELHRLNGTLEQRVMQRTEELADALEKLQRESNERQAAENALRQAQRMESLGKLTGGVAHDFNNLLQVVGGNLQLLLKDVSGNERADKRVQNALAGVARGSKLASQLLAFGRRQPLEPKVVNIGRFIKNMDDMLRRALGEEVEVETVISGGLWNTLVDPGQIENALLNLAINARDAMDGRGRLTIEAGNALLDDAYTLQHDDVDTGQYVMVAVTDTGSGISPDILDRVFEPFFSTKPEGKGTGLGLSMVYGFVKQSGGHIKLYSEPGEGTTVRLYLPRVLQSEDVLAAPPTQPAIGGNETVLVAEDDEAVRETAVALLSDLGYRVLQARDATSALNVMESGVPIDLLFTDVVMPGPLRSPELARKARERLPNIAVLFTSGYTENAIVHGGRLDMGVELLSKPYTREALARKVRHVLANRAQQRLAVEGRAAAEAAVAAPVEPAKRALKVLLVEDDELIRASTAEILAEQNHQVQQAGDADAALRLLNSQRFDVLLTDVGLPKVSGIDLARQAVQSAPHLRIMFATGHAISPAEVGIPDALVLLKPYHPEDLSRVLGRVGARDASAGGK